MHDLTARSAERIWPSGYLADKTKAFELGSSQASVDKL
jgi:hypothetical protein